jgi:hypothetical protein
VLLFLQIDTTLIFGHVSNATSVNQQKHKRVRWCLTPLLFDVLLNRRSCYGIELSLCPRLHVWQTSSLHTTGFYTDMAWFWWSIVCSLLVQMCG